jgi:sigma-E factor negative regulatory protein RseA
MSKESLERLSNLMDGECTREAGSFLSRRLSSDEDMCDTWERYHLIRDCIRQPGSKQVVIGLSAKLDASLGAEEAPAFSPRSQKRWLKPVSGLAIAASVALMAIVVTAPPQSELSGTDDSANMAVANQPFVSPNALPLAPASQAVSYAPATQQAQSNRLNAYLLRHNQMARTAGRQGFVSFVPIVATPVASVAENLEDRPDSKAGSNSETKASKPDTAVNR